MVNPRRGQIVEYKDTFGEVFPMIVVQIRDGLVEGHVFYVGEIAYVTARPAGNLWPRGNDGLNPGEWCYPFPTL